MKVVLPSSEAVERVLRNAKTLRGTTRFNKVYIAPDRSREEREERKVLVAQIKEKMCSDPQRYHYIKNGVVCSREKESVPSPQSTTSSSSSSAARTAASSSIPRIPPPGQTSTLNILHSTLRR